ncbi:hypothetical protein QL285_046613 [Trifolium repens]|nr:hypothetical protein QL285_046613 [Trifolium repens]
MQAWQGRESENLQSTLSFLSSPRQEQQNTNNLPKLQFQPLFTCSKLPNSSIHSTTPLSNHVQRLEKSEFTSFHTPSRDQHLSTTMPPFHFTKILPNHVACMRNLRPTLFCPLQLQNHYKYTLQSQFRSSNNQQSLPNPFLLIFVFFIKIGV